MFGIKTWWSKNRAARPEKVVTEPDASGLYLIEFEMMLKGSVYKRTYETVRQIGVTVDGKTCLVTSGDRVNRETYEALLDGGVLRQDYYGVRETIDPPDADASEEPRAMSA